VSFRLSSFLLPFIALLVVPLNGEAQERKRAHATRVAEGAIRLDGSLDEPAWSTGRPIVDFVQREPVEGAAPFDPTEVRIVYDDEAIYVGARMASSGGVRAPLGRRDEAEQAEHLLVSLDTYLDRRTASTFGVTAAGVRLDSYSASDEFERGDDGFSPVWGARVLRGPAGWTAEMRIPFSQLRFNDRSPQVWGLNIERRVPVRNERVFWALVPRTDTKWASLFGDLHGIDGIRPRRRLELLPYIAGASHVIGDRDRADPFSSAANVDGRTGLDLKMGLGSNLTLEATVNPDFGQVEADPAEVNLSALETFFDERRPFFLEGADLLTGYPNNFFYSRRIGAAPPGRAVGEYVDQPRAATILGAAKLTGRLASGTSIGVLSGVTGDETARAFTPGTPIGSIRVAPTAVFGVARVEQEFGPPGSTVGLMTTLLHRDMRDGEPLAAQLTSSAITVSGDAIVRLRGGEYEWRGSVGGTHVAGSAAAIDRIQRSSAHYFQRPDATYFGYDPTRTSLAGTKSDSSIERRTGRHWNWGGSAQLETAGFESNDLGRLSSADGLQSIAWVAYRETVPGSWYRNYHIKLTHDRRYTYDWIRRQGFLQAEGTLELPNFWTTTVYATRNVRSQDERLTRGGPLMGTPRGWNFAALVDSNRANRLQTDFVLEYGRNEDGGLNASIGTEIEFFSGSRWGVSAKPQYLRLVDVRQYLATLDGGPAATFGSRYVFGRVDRTTYSTQLRANYTFKPDMTLDFYAEPFAASGRSDRVGELAAARSRALRLYGTSGTTLTPLTDGALQVIDGGETFLLANRDFNVLSFRSNLVLRWEWRPGSTLYLVWQQDRAADAFEASRATIRDMFSSLRARGDNYFVVKASFWLSPS
jgi:hypothetical protein